MTVSYIEAIDIPQFLRNEVNCAILSKVEVKRFHKTVFFFKYFTVHSTPFFYFGSSIVLLFSLYFLLLIILRFFNVSDTESVSSLVRFKYTFSIDHPFCKFSSIAATVKGSYPKYGSACGCLAILCQGKEHCLFLSCWMTLYTTK